jgi:hypothetical protein
VSKVTSLHSTFKDADLFNSDITNWATSEVTSLEHTFNNAIAFNGGKSIFFYDFDISHKQAQLIYFFSFSIITRCIQVGRVQGRFFVCDI